MKLTTTALLYVEKGAGRGRRSGRRKGTGMKKEGENNEVLFRAIY